MGLICLTSKLIFFFLLKKKRKKKVALAQIILNQLKKKLVIGFTKLRFDETKLHMPQVEKLN